jgi:hypothetical protein
LSSSSEIALRCEPPCGAPADERDTAAAHRDTNHRSIAMRKLLTILALCGTLPLVVACEPTIEQREQDVRDAHRDAVENVAEEQKDVQDAAKAGAENVIEEQRDVEDAAREGTEAITQEQRELEDAKRREAERAAETTPPTVP